MVSVLLPDGKEVDSKLTDSTGRVVFKSLLGITYSESVLAGTLRPDLKGNCEE